MNINMLSMLFRLFVFASNLGGHIIVEFYMITKSDMFL